MDYSIKEGVVDYIFAKTKDIILPSKRNNYKSRFLQSNILLFCVILLLVFKITTVLISINFPQNIFFADITESALESFVNTARQSSGLQPLAENEKLNEAATLKAENMVQNQYFNHTSPSGITPWYWFSEAGYKYKYAGENLAIGFYESEEVYNAWLNSPSHRANILSPNYSEFGTAVLKDPSQNNAIIVVQEFGSQLPQKQAVTATKPVIAQQSGNTKPVVTRPVITQQEEDVTIQTTGPAETTDNQAPTVVGETETQNFLQLSSGTGANNLPVKALNLFLYNSDEVLQGATYGVSMIVIGILFALILFNFNIKFKRELVFRAVLIVVLLSVTTLVNKELIISLIPHQIII